MLQKGVSIILCTCALLCVHVDCTATSAGTEDITIVHGISEIGHSVSNRQVFAESHELHRYTREDLNGYRDMDTENMSVWNCSRLYDSSYGYNESSCRFVRDNCQTKAHLINYLTFMKCDLPSNIKPVGYILLIMWCFYLISLLATTVDNFFVPPLIFLAEKLKLSPSIAGITLLALGNGAPDIFCVYSGLGQGDLALVLGSLAGGAMFITSVILATVIIVARKGTSNINKVDFIRDSVALVIVISAVVAVAFDGVVYLFEVLVFPLLYAGYIVVLLLITFLRNLCIKRLNMNGSSTAEEQGIVDEESEAISEGGSVRLNQHWSESQSQEWSQSLSQTWSEGGSESPNQLGIERLSQRWSGSLSLLGRETRSQLGSERVSHLGNERAGHLGSERADHLGSQRLSRLGSGRVSHLGSGRASGVNTSVSFFLERSLALRMVSKSTEVVHRSTSETKPLADMKERPRVELPGLTWPAGHHIIVKIIWAIQWPFSLLRWLTIPPFCPSGVTWSKWHYVFAVISPTPMVILVLLAAKGWAGFAIMVGVVPLPVIVTAIGLVMSVLMAVLLRPSRPPHWGMLAVLVSLAFTISIVWLNIIANEVVGVLTALGLLLNIKTAILGLTVLALGNCMADWVADTVVAKAGNTQMAFASCFGSPMLSHVLGLSVAFAVRISIDNDGAPYVFDINMPQYSVVKLAWIFLGISLLSSIIMFPIFKFKPPLFYAIFLVCFYVLFAVIAVLCAIGIIPLLW